MTANQCLPITDFVKRAYLVYFKIKLGDQDTRWAPHKVCGARVASLRIWSKGQKCHRKFGDSKISVIFAQSSNPL